MGFVMAFSFMRTLYFDHSQPFPPLSCFPLSHWSPFFSQIVPLLFSYLFFFFGCIGVSTQGFVLSRQVLYCLSHTSNSFCSVYLGDRILLFFQPAWTTILLLTFPAIIGMTGMHHHAQSFVTEIESC
jgi:hypothetical protein